MGGGGGGGGGEGRGSVGWSCWIRKGILKISKTKQKDISEYPKKKHPRTCVIGSYSLFLQRYAERCVIWIMDLYTGSWMLYTESLTDLLLLGYSCILAGWVGGGGGGGGGGGEGRGSVGWSCQNKGILKISKTKRKDISKYQKGTLALALLAPTPFPSNGMQKGV